MSDIFDEVPEFFKAVNTGDSDSRGGQANDARN